MFSTLTLSYSECVLVPQLNLIACILLCCLKCMSCTEIHVVNIIIHSQSVKYLFVYSMSPPQAAAGAVRDGAAHHLSELNTDLQWKIFLHGLTGRFVQLDVCNLSCLHTIKVQNFYIY